MIFIGAIGFLLLMLSDYLKLKRFFGGTILTFIGFILIGFSIAQTALDASLDLSVQSAIGVAGSLFFGFMLIYSLFIELSFKKTYIKKSHEVYQDGTYALCRHPGVLWLMFLILFLSMMTRSFDLFVMGINYTVINTLYIIYQEKLIFIHQFEGYRDYQQTVPFLIPTRKSFKAMIKK